MVFWMLVLFGTCGVVAGEWIIGRLDRSTPVVLRARRVDLQVPQKVR